MPKIQITAKGIRAALKKYSPYQSLVEYVWNGFDAKASKIEINYAADELGNIESITISDNGYGIPHDKLQEKFEPLFESKKALENKLKKNQSALHGKNGIGRLTFFSFARNASWQTTYGQDGKNWTYDIYANAENINFYTGINAVPKQTEGPTGTAVTFSGIHSINSFLLEEKFQDFLLKEFAWFLALNSRRDFMITINGAPLEWKKMVADMENFELIYEKSSTKFSVTYVRWSEKSSNEPSRYYYLDGESLEKWKEPTAIKNKGEQFYHSVFIQSPYFDEFSFQNAPQSNQEPLISGTRRDAQFRFLRRKLANFLRIKRRPFLKTFAAQLLIEYAQKNVLPTQAHKNLGKTIMTLYEMQPKFFNSLNHEQKKMFTGLLDMILKNGRNEDVLSLLGSIIELNDEEKTELTNLFIIQDAEKAS